MKGHDRPDSDTESMENTKGRVPPASYLQKAVKHVSDLWFPVNEALLADIQSRIQKGSFAQDVSGLVTEIAGDFSLFTYCLRGLARLIKKEEPDLVIPAVENPLALLEWAGFERLQKILSVEASDISAHSFKSTTPPQRERIQEAMVSASTAEALASSYHVDPDLAYSTGLLRQLGLTLVSWNYPVVYQKAMQEVIKGKSLDTALGQMFGFSPSMLALTVMSSWGLPSSLYRALSESDSSSGGWNDDDEIKAIAATLARICSVGEALARANNPSSYPTAHADWHYAKAEIEEALGSDGMEVIRDTLAQNCLSYTQLTPHVFTPAFVLDPQARITQHQSGEVAKTNPYVGECRPFLRQKLTAWYEKLTPETISRDALIRLTKDILPSCGFFEGVVYTIDPTAQLLVPQLCVGNLLVRTVTPVRYLASDIEDAEEHQVASAFKSHGPLVRTVMNSQGGVVVAIAGPLGFSQRVGVLYLAIRGASFSGDEAQHLLHFKALSQALNDSLGLK